MLLLRYLAPLLILPAIIHAQELVPPDPAERVSEKPGALASPPKVFSEYQKRVPGLEKLKPELSEITDRFQFKFGEHPVDAVYHRAGEDSEMLVLVRADRIIGYIIQAYMTGGDTQLWRETTGQALAQLFPPPAFQQVSVTVGKYREREYFLYTILDQNAYNAAKAEATKAAAERLKKLVDP